MRTLLLKTVILLSMMPLAAFANSVVLELVGQGVPDPVYVIADKKIVNCHDMKYWGGSQSRIEVKAKALADRSGVCSYSSGLKLFDGIDEVDLNCHGNVCSFKLAETKLKDGEFSFAVYE
ncbi:hypothetical protein [Rheinheimera sp.]|uniref:hypothetical protein n=1 Tax=Rheinheimera sp. TaxID=1869214 RepID=UPI004048C61C